MSQANGAPVLAFAADVVTLLRDDHRHIEQGFSRYLHEECEAQWGGLLHSVLVALKVHMELEEEFLYPAYAAAAGTSKRHLEALVEHEGMKRLIEDIENSDPGDDYFEAMIRVLWKTAKSHMLEEEDAGGMFSMISGSTLPTSAEQLSMRRDELVESLAVRTLRLGVVRR